jgi:hypothetical protein
VRRGLGNQAICFYESFYSFEIAKNRRRRNFTTRSGSETACLIRYINRRIAAPAAITKRINMFIEILSENNLLINTEAAQAGISFIPAMFQAAPSTPVMIFLFILFLAGITAPFLVLALTIITWYKNKWLLINGDPAEAKILKIWETGASANEQPQIGFLLEVHARNRPVYRAEAKRFVSILNIPRIQIGSTVEVKFDPRDPSRIAVVL